MKTLKINGTTVFEKNWEAINTPGIRFIKNEGGSRSSKTYSLCQVLILYCLKNPKILVSIVRKTNPALMTSVFRDFKEVMVDLGIWDDNLYSKGGQTYNFANGSRIEFFSADQEQKLRGRKRDIAWVNEANELGYDEFQQLNLRTTKLLIVDYNPSAVDSYLYELPIDKTISIHSTFKDNPFLEPAIIEEIMNYKNTDPDYFTIFALGKRAHSRENVYMPWRKTEKPVHLDDFIYAIDYGFNHPTAMVKIWYTPEAREVWIEEVIYESGLTSKDIIDRMKKAGVDPTKIIVSETARPEILADIKRSGYSIITANKNVSDGISCVRTFKVAISPTSDNIEKENMNYRFVKKNGHIREDVIKAWDDAMDAIRYGLMYIKKYKMGSTDKPQVYSFEF